MQYPEAFNHLIECFKHLPGIGSKSAERLAYYILNMDDVYVKEFADALSELHQKIHYCKTCGNICEGEECEICKDPTRDHSMICVVEKP